MSRPLTQPQFRRATFLAADFFCVGIAGGLRQESCPPNGNAEMEIFQDPALKRCYRTVKKLGRAAGAVFSEEMIDHLEERARHFDKVTGFKGLSDAFVELRSAREWILDIVDAISEEVSRLAREGSSMISLSSPRSAPCSVVEFQLEGPTVKDAWNSNSISRDHESQANVNARLPDTEHRRLPVFHGTGSLRGLSLADKVFERLGDIRTGNDHRHQQAQVVPTHESLPIVSTTFSPLRAFLWALFYSEVIQSVPIGDWNIGEKKQWECQGHTHAGVTVCEFLPSICATEKPRQTVYLTPEGRESAWYEIVRRLDASELGTAIPSEIIWSQLSPIHGTAQKEWPNVIHSQEFGTIRKTLASCVRQWWGSVWFGGSIGLLRESYRRTYSISFKQVDRAVPVVPQFMRIGL
ncbi:hypothetical protein B0T16DRAFT_390313 [Cercophora newfieldiana]|uniref:Uncharacterized protein n=1 Tax=Cercophora newfieldiana TaxID=92897 RepID=A0AA40CQC9_9PEZI|nr:hypothetical protein B0T16DRAFT_390313 [Cercophora newfieldiana]